MNNPMVKKDFERDDSLEIPIKILPCYRNAPYRKK